MFFIFLSRLLSYNTQLHHSHYSATGDSPIWSFKCQNVPVLKSTGIASTF